MTVHLVTFATEDMGRALNLCYESAWRNGVPRHNLHDWTFSKLCDSTLMELKPIKFWAERGCGFWTWKSFIVEREMLGLHDGDTLIYADAGVEFINNVSRIIDRMGHDKPQDDIWLFGNNWEHAHWCKRDVIEVVWPTFANAPMGRSWNAVADSATWTRFGKQVQASVIFFRVSDYTRKFVKEWLDWCLFEGGRLIDDSPSRLPNHPEFQEHRHDQAILTTMAYREGIKLHWWPAVYNRGGSPEFVYEKLPEYAGDDYPVLFSHHRRRDHEWSNAA